MFTTIFTLFLASVVQDTFLNTGGCKSNIIIKYIETKWYINLTKCGYYRVLKNIAYCTTGVDLDLIWGQYNDLGST